MTSTDAKPLTGQVMRAMELSELQAHLRSLITLEEDEAPLVSAYVPIGQSGAVSNPMEARVREIRKLLSEQERVLFGQPFDRILHYLAHELRPTTRGVAAFARGGERPFFLGLQFQVPVPDRLSVGSTPDVYHLVELKDTYHRYVVLIANEGSARILEVNLGAVTREVWTNRPELRERVGREWTHEHYQDHRRDRSDRFLKEKVELLERLMAAGGHTHLILAGSPRMTARVRKVLSKRLLDKLIDVVPAQANARPADVVEATLASFIEREQRESHEAVALLVRTLRRGGLAVAGTRPTLAALRRGQADMLIMARDYDPGPAWACRSCHSVTPNASPPPPSSCESCGSTELKSTNLKEVMVHHAERQSLTVEIVQHSSVLTELSGVGCLLRYETFGPESESGPGGEPGR